MPVCCAVCKSSFKDRHALQMHKTAKGHSEPAVREASGGTQMKSDISKTALPSTIKVESSDMSINPEERAMEATSQQSTLAKNSDNDGVPLARSSILISQASVTEDPKAQHPPTLQLQSSLANVQGSMGHGQLKHLGKEWSTISLFEQPLALKVLRDLCHPVSDLEENGYRLRQYTLIDLLGWQRCKGCKKRQRDVQSHQTPCTASVKKNKRLIPNKEHPSLHHDLEVLGMLHTQVVDSAILAAKTIDLPGAKTVGLKKMCKEILNVDVQCSNGGMHDCLEDVLASRELVLRWIYNPEKLQRWALLKREEELERNARLRSQRERKKASASRQNTEKGKGNVTNFRDYASNSFDFDDPGYSDHEVLRWEDIAEDLGWPHPDTGYDPWSD
ncbi:MAG: hypothetical protein Q9204_004349 [Flavoplaca sp. TL-2023a]